MFEIQKASKLVRKYNKMTGKSIKISINVWKFEDVSEVRVKMSLSAVDPDTYECIFMDNMSLKEIIDFINSREILFRKFA